MLSLLTFLRIAAAAGITLEVVPWLAWPRGRRSFGRWAVESLVAATAFWCLLGYLLAALRAIELATMVLAAVIGILAARKLLSRTRSAPKTPPKPWLAVFFDLFEVPKNTLRQELGWTFRIPRFQRPWAYLLFAALVLAVGLVTLDPLLFQVSPGTGDGYAALLAIKMIALNQGLYRLGLYPQGFFLLAGQWAAAYFINPINLVRFLGPLAAMLTVAAVGALVYRTSRHPGGLWVAAGLAGLTSWPALTFRYWSWIDPLSVKWAAIFFPLALVFALDYSQTRHPRSLALLATTLADIAFFSPGVLVYAVLAVIGAQWTLFRRPRDFARLVLAEAVGSAVGLLPLGIGYLSGKAASPVLWPVPRLAPADFMLAEPIVIGIGLAVAGLALAFFGLRREKSEGERIASIGLSLAGVSGLTALGLFTHTGFLQTAVTAGLPGLLAIACVAAWLPPASGQHPFVAGAAAIGAAALYLITPLPPIPLAHFVPPGEGRAYLTIARTFPRYQWTIVSPVYEYSEVLGEGFHQELITFIRQHPLAQASQPSYTLACVPGASLTTPNVFLFIDLRPDGQALTPAQTRWPLGQGADAYRGRYLVALEARTLAWARQFRQAHPNSTHIFFKNQNVMVLWIQQKGNISCPKSTVSPKRSARDRGVRANG